MADSLFTWRNLQEQRLKESPLSREETELLMRYQIGSLILIYAMNIHYDRQAILYLCTLHNNNLLHCNT